MLRQVADGVLVHESEFCQSNAVVVAGQGGVLLVDPGVQEQELTCLAGDLADLGQPVVAGFSTHPHWDHLLWHAALGTAPRYATALGAATAQQRLADPEVKARIAATMIPSEFREHVPLDLLGLVDGLPADASYLPWDGPRVRVVEHRAHAAGHAALVVEDSGVLVAGDMLSDVLVPMLDLNAADDPVDEYLAALRLLEAVAGDVAVVVPGHGSVGDADQVRARVGQDRAYVEALRDGGVVDDPRLEPSAPFGATLRPGLHERQVEYAAGRAG